MPWVQYYAVIFMLGSVIRGDNHALMAFTFQNPTLKEFKRKKNKRGMIKKEERKEGGKEGWMEEEKKGKKGRKNNK